VRRRAQSALASVTLAGSMLVAPLQIGVEFPLHGPESRRVRIASSDLPVEQAAGSPDGRPAPDPFESHWPTAQELVESTEPNVDPAPRIRLEDDDELLLEKIFRRSSDEQPPPLDGHTRDPSGWPVAP
jgi:hypothetical protein